MTSSQAGMSKKQAWGKDEELATQILSGLLPSPLLCPTWLLLFHPNDTLWQLSLQLNTLSTLRKLCQNVAGVFYPWIFTVYLLDFLTDLTPYYFLLVYNCFTVLVSFAVHHSEPLLLFSSH